jgi:hypothetical protein
VFAQTGDVSALVLLLGDFAALAERTGPVDRYWRLLAASHALRRTTGADVGLVSVDSIGLNAPDRPPEGDAAAQAAWREGEAMTTEGAIAYALDQPAD